MQLKKFMDLALTSNDTLRGEIGGQLDDTIKIEFVSPDNGPQEETDISTSLLDVDIDSDPDSDASFSIDTKRARKLPWPIQDHNKFLKIERKMLQDGAFTKNLVSCGIIQ